MRMRTHFIFFSTTLFFLLFSACSLRYGMANFDDSSTPELTFTDVNFDRYEDDKKTLELQANRLEQYKGGNEFFARDLNFQIIEDDEVKTEGKCSLLAADSDAEKYVFYDDIEINNKKDDLTVIANNLKWNGKNEQLISGRNDVVTITKGKTIIQGSGFSASGVSKKFSFTGVITGSTETGDGEENSENNTDKIENIGENENE